MNRRTFLKLAAGLIASYPFLIEHYIILLNEYRVPVPNLPKEFSGFRIAHLTDFHYSPLLPLGLMEWLVRKTNRLKKDMTVCTGDYVFQGG